MTNFNCVPILMVLIPLVYCDNTTSGQIQTTNETTSTATTAITDRASELGKNTTTHFKLLGNRKAVLIVDSDEMLSQRKQRDKNKDTAKVLRYEEFTVSGDKAVEFTMFSLDDVVRFFDYYLHTEICHGRCDPVPQPITAKPDR